MIENKKIIKRFIRILLVIGVFSLSGCSLSGNSQVSGEQKKNDEGGSPLKIAFYPNESAAEFEHAREEIKDILQKAIERDVEIVTSTDYNVVVESIVNGQVDLAYMGAEGYIEANKKNSQVQAILTNSGPSGTLEDALYYSFLAVREKDSKAYETKGNRYTIEPIRGKTISFVTNTSTSGFKVPSHVISEHFDIKSSDGLIMDGDFFEKVLFGGSHQGAMVNLLRGDADAAAFMNMPQYVDVVEGEENRTGVLYEVKKDAEAPFDTVRGEKFRVILSTPVLNGPIAANKENLNKETISKISAALRAEEVARNEKIFAPKESKQIGMFSKEGNEQYVEVTDDFYDEIREMGS